MRGKSRRYGRLFSVQLIETTMYGPMNSLSVAFCGPIFVKLCMLVVP